MPRLEVKDLPDSTPAALRAFDDPEVLRQKREMEKLVGSWDDSSTADEIIADIQTARTASREVPL